MWTRLKRREGTGSATIVQILGFLIPVDELMDSKTLHSSTCASPNIVEVLDFFDSVCLRVSPASKCCLIIEPLPPESKACSVIERRKRLVG